MDQSLDPIQQPKAPGKKRRNRGKGKGKAAETGQPAQQGSSSGQDSQQNPAKKSRSQKRRARRAAKALSKSIPSASKIDNSKAMDEEKRRKAMIAATISDLGSARAEHIRTAQRERHVAADAVELAASRRSNQQGSLEAKWAADEVTAKALSSWNNFAKEANPDAEADDGTAGQSHRARMVAGLHSGGIGNHPAPSARGGFAGRGGRGGGFAGSGISRGLRVDGLDSAISPVSQRSIRGGKSAPPSRAELQLQVQKGLENLATAKELAKSFGKTKGKFQGKPQSKPQGKVLASPNVVHKVAKPTKPLITPPRLVGSADFVAKFQNTSGLGLRSDTKLNAGLGNSSFSTTLPKPIVNAGKENKPVFQSAVEPLKPIEESKDDVFGRGSNYISLSDVTNQSAKDFVAAPSVQQFETPVQAVKTPVALFDVKPGAVKQITSDPASFFDNKPVVTKPIAIKPIEVKSASFFDNKPVAIDSVAVKPAEVSPAPFFDVDAMVIEPSDPIPAPVVTSWATVLGKELDSTKFEAPRRRAPSQTGTISSLNSKYMGPERISWHPVGPRPVPVGLKYIQAGYDASNSVKENEKSVSPKIRSAGYVPPGLKVLQAGYDAGKIAKENEKPVVVEAVPESSAVTQSSSIANSIPEEEDEYTRLEREIEAELRRDGLFPSENEDDYDATLRRVVAQLKQEGFIDSDNESIDTESDDTEL